MPTVDHTSHTVIALLLAVAVLSQLASRIRVPYPILLVVAGLAIAAIPGLPVVQLSPGLVFLVFLPPILYYSGVLTSWRDFKANIRPITGLAFGLVLATTVCVAAVAHYWIGMEWPAAFTLGAIVSPPDAASATAICQRLRVPKRVVTILEGESLVNDATALVVYKFAVAATLVHTFSPTSATGEFFYAAIGGVLIGYVAAKLATWMLSKIADTTQQHLVTLLTPFVAYIPAEWAHTSGVLAAVTAGLYVGRFLPKLAVRARLQAWGIWELVVFLLNGLIFVLIGLQLPVVARQITQIGDVTVGMLLGYSAAVCLIAIGVRLGWVLLFGSIPMPSWGRKGVPAEKIATGELFVIGWTGMRGIVSLAAALALPTEPMFPHRDLIIFLTFGVILATLVLQGLSLPAVIRLCRLSPDGHEGKEERYARLESAHAALSRLEVMGFDGNISPELLERVRAPYNERIQVLGGEAHTSVGLDPFDPDVMQNKLRREALVAERKMLAFLRDENIIGDEILRKLMTEIDLDETKLA